MADAAFFLSNAERKQDVALGCRKETFTEKDHVVMSLILLYMHR
jgi:hypothetical protein